MVLVAAHGVVPVSRPRAALLSRGGVASAVRRILQLGLRGAAVLGLAACDPPAESVPVDAASFLDAGIRCDSQVTSPPTVWNVYAHATVLAMNADDDVVEVFLEPTPRPSESTWPAFSLNRVWAEGADEEDGADWVNSTLGTSDEFWPSVCFAWSGRAAVFVAVTRSGRRATTDDFDLEVYD